MRALWMSATPTPDTEANAERMCGAFEAQVFAIEKEIAGHTARARALVGAAKSLRDQKNPAFAKKEAEAKAAVVAAQGQQGSALSAVLVANPVVVVAVVALPRTVSRLVLVASVVPVCASSIQFKVIR